MMVRLRFRDFGTSSLTQPHQLGRHAHDTGSRHFE